MTKLEFLESLQRILIGSLSSSQVMEHVTYYQEYIEIEVRKGRMEEDVTESLGNPRFLAKTIIEASRQSERDNENSREHNEAVRRSATGRKSVFEDFFANHPKWIIAIMIIGILFVVFFLISMLGVFMPMILPIVVVIIILRIINSKKE